jgi:hypothetical protein
MRGVSYSFFLSATLHVCAGMALGNNEMAASGDHSLASAHPHLNLVGWISMGLRVAGAQMTDAASPPVFGSADLSRLKQRGTFLFIAN